MKIKALFNSCHDFRLSIYKEKMLLEYEKVLIPNEESTWSTYEIIIIQSVSQTFQGKFLFDVLRIQSSKWTKNKTTFSKIYALDKLNEY